MLAMQIETLGGLASQFSAYIPKEKNLRWLTRWVHRLIPRGRAYTILSVNAVTLRLGIRNNGGRRRRLDRTTRPWAGADASVNTGGTCIFSKDSLAFGTACSEDIFYWGR